VDSAAESEFTEFVVRHSYQLLRVAYALTGEQYAAQDLLQVALAKTAARWSHVHTDPGLYVKRALYHEYVSSWRRRWRWRETSVAVLPEPAGERDPSNDAVLRIVLLNALRRLTPRQRAVLVLRYMEDLSERQVAEVLGCSLGTVASQASRALARLRAALPAGTGPPSPRSLSGPSRRRE
jgi:RNA polymerase sigma-70 factor (sigma-E family)